MKEKILKQGRVKVEIENVQSMSHDDYALARKNGFGASDTSVLLGVNLYKTTEQLIQEKNNKIITAEEKAVSDKPIVKKGYDVEPIILDKASEQLKTEIYKPEDMFSFKDVDGLNINFDGVIEESGKLIPVEAKLVSRYGEKYYNKAITFDQAKQVSLDTKTSDITMHVKRMATMLGIPAYYYTQVQTEIAALNAPYGYLAAQFDETWSFKLFYVPRDEYTISKIFQRAESTIQKVKRS